MLLLPVPPCNLLSMCVTLLPLSCQVLTRSPQWPWCPRWPRCRLLLLRCPAAGWHQHSPRAQPRCRAGAAAPRGAWGFRSPTAPEVSPAQPLQWARPCSLRSSHAGFGTDPLSSCGWIRRRRLAWGGWQLPAEPRSSCPLLPATAMEMLQRPRAPSCPA